MPQGVTRSNRVLKNISKDQDFFHATREFCTILSHRQRGSQSEIAKFKELPRNLLVTKKLQTRIPIVKGVIVLHNNTPLSLSQRNKWQENPAVTNVIVTEEQMAGEPLLPQTTQKPY